MAGACFTTALRSNRAHLKTIALKKILPRHAFLQQSLEEYGRVSPNPQALPGHFTIGEVAKGMASLILCKSRRHQWNLKRRLLWNQGISAKWEFCASCFRQPNYKATFHEPERHGKTSKPWQVQFRNHKRTGQPSHIWQQSNSSHCQPNRQWFLVGIPYRLAGPELSYALRPYVAPGMLLKPEDWTVKPKYSNPQMDTD